MGYFEQTNVNSLNDQFTIEDELINSHPDFDRQAARNICGSMMFEKDAALKKISVLSGGEKSRVMLGKLLISPLNLVILDEPSNHLDIEACDAFVAALNNFEGGMILVTHNEMFLHALVNRLVIFKKKGVSVFEGSYQEFLEKEGWEEEEQVEAKKSKPAVISKKELRQKKSEIIAVRSRAINPIQKIIDGIEDYIEEKEDQIRKINEKLLIASQDQDGAKIQILSKELAGLEREVESLFEDLEKHMDKIDFQKKIFEKQLSALERC